MLILISAFITFQYLQTYLGFLLLAFYYVSLYKISPYNNPQLNFAEAISLVSSAFILYSGLYFVQGKTFNMAVSIIIIFISAEETNTVSYILFACDIISGIAFVAYVAYVVFKKNAPTIQQKITKLGSKIRTNLKVKTNSKHARLPSLQSPTSLTSTERIMSIEGLLSTTKFMSTERFTSTENFTSTERFMSTEGLMPTDRKIYDC